MIIATPSPDPQPCTKNFSDLPHELLDEIFGHLAWKEILHSSNLICKKIQSVIDKDYFWQKRLDAAIKLPVNLHNLPQLKDIPMKRIFAAIRQARFYTWGESTLGKLGHSYPITGSAVRSHRVPRGVAIPLEIRTIRNVFIVDIGVGGWSTHFLTFGGDVFSFGSMNGHTTSHSKLQKRFPDPIIQISAGRNHLVALSCEGEIYSYNDIKSEPKRVRFLDNPIVKGYPNCKYPKYRQVTKVVGGWNCSGALVQGVGIIIWKFEAKLNQERVQAVFKDMPIEPSDNWVEESLVPQPSQPLETGSDQPQEQILDFVLLEGYLVFLTTAGNTYTVELTNALPSSPPILLQCFSTPPSPTPSQKLTHLSGSFQRFAVYNYHSLIHTGNTTILKLAIEATRRVSTPDPDRPEFQPLAMPDLRRFAPIAQIAFGDYHTHAVTQDGVLLSWGVESQNCGCLGIGDSLESSKRGVIWESGNGALGEAAEVFLRDPPYPESVYPKKTPGGEVDWDSMLDPMTREGREKGDLRLDEKEFCVLSVKAAGWHSGALVIPITEHLRTGCVGKSGRVEVFPAIGGEAKREDEGDGGHEKEVDPSMLGRPRTGHRGIRGISTVATGMRGGLVGGGRHDEGDGGHEREVDPNTLRTGHMASRGFEGVTMAQRGVARGPRSGTMSCRTDDRMGMRMRQQLISRELELDDDAEAMSGQPGRGQPGRPVFTRPERQPGEESAAAGERLGESIRNARSGGGPAE